MKLREIIKRANNPGRKRLEIDYRTYTPDNHDILVGICHYDYSTGELISDDGDSYYLDDEIDGYDFFTDEFSGDQFLLVWYKSEWVE